MQLSKINGFFLVMLIFLSYSLRLTCLTESSGEGRCTLTVEVVESRHASTSMSTRTALQRTRTSIVLGHVMMSRHSTRRHVVQSHQHSVHRKLFPVTHENTNNSTN